jgi:AcrR family transcriptional regulator
MSGQEATKARLVEAAGEEFAAKGYEGATIREICKRAGANVAAVNYHFGDKEQLYILAVIEAHRCGVEMPPESDAMEGAPAEQLRRYIRHFLDNVLALDDAGWHHALMLREMIAPTDASTTLVRDVIRPKFERLVAILRRLHPDADPRRLHATAFSVVGQCLHYRMARPIARRLIGEAAYAALDLDYLTDHITAVTLAALGIGPPLDFGDGEALATASGSGSGREGSR